MFSVSAMPLLMAVDWMALLQVAGVTIAATVVISALMSLANWCFTPAEGLEAPSPPRRALGITSLGVMVVFVLFGLYLMIPYFPKPW